MNKIKLDDLIKDVVMEGALEVIEEKNSKKPQNNESVSKEETEIKEAIQEGALEAIEEVNKSKKEASEEGKKLSRKAKKTKKKEKETEIEPQPQETETQTEEVVEKPKKTYKENKKC